MRSLETKTNLTTPKNKQSGILYASNLALSRESDNSIQKMDERRISVEIDSSTEFKNVSKYKFSSLP